MAATAQKVTVKLGFTKTTKNTVRYDAADDAAAIPSLYVQQSGLPKVNGEFPREITVTVTV